jgi:hypothetical protein
MVGRVGELQIEANVVREREREEMPWQERTFHTGQGEAVHTAEESFAAVSTHALDLEQ